MYKTEFRSGEEVVYDLRTPVRWIISHIKRYPLFPILALLCTILSNVGYSAIQVLVGHGFDVLQKPLWLSQELLTVAILVALAASLQGFTNLGRNLSFEFLAQRIERDTRAELYTSLLGKSQTFHASQRIGDIMARSTNDVHFMNLMISPGVMLILDSFLTIIVPLAAVALINWQLLLVPVIFLILLYFSVRHYNRKINPATSDQRAAFGHLNGNLADALEGIETVKANVGEARELKTFARGASTLRDIYIRIAHIQAKYWPLLIFAFCMGLGLLHALILWKQGLITMGNVVSYMLLYNAFRFATFVSLFSFNLYQMGLASASRVLEMIKSRTDLDENTKGHNARIEGRVEFRAVSFSFNTTEEGTGLILHDAHFLVEAGETVAIVGRTGAGKSSLVKLINRIYDVTEGQVLIDGVDVREWDLESLRSQVATIDQDIFLFSKSITENIGFGAKAADQGQIEEAAKAAQAHDFIQHFEKKYDTEVGERGVTLSGGQKQRVAIARAFIADPRILVLDDSTSAIDSQTEEEIQKAMKRASAGRTTFIITHRLSQIRWADRILLIDKGRILENGNHDELMQRSSDYRRLFVYLQKRKNQSEAVPS